MTRPPITGFLRGDVSNFCVGMAGASGIVAGKTAVSQSPKLDRGFLLPQSRLSSYDRCMTKLLEQAIEAVRRLPADSQDDIARAILHLAGSEIEPEPVDPAHLSAVLEGLAEAKP